MWTVLLYKKKEHVLANQMDQGALVREGALIGGADGVIITVF